MEDEDIQFEIIKQIDSVEALQKFCKLNKQYITFCQNNAEMISKNILNKFKVNYTDPTNFIYVMNKKNIDDYRQNGQWKYKSLFKLYMTHYYKKEINCSNLGITSFPIYPNMKVFYGQNNLLTNFPVQPEMKVFDGRNNPLKDFPIQPKMKFCSPEKICGTVTSLNIDNEVFEFEGQNITIKGFSLEHIYSDGDGVLFINTIPSPMDFEDNFYYELAMDEEFNQTLQNILQSYGLKLKDTEINTREYETYVYHVNKDFIKSWEQNIGPVYLDIYDYSEDED